MALLLGTPETSLFTDAGDIKAKAGSLQDLFDIAKTVGPSRKLATCHRTFNVAAASPGPVCIATRLELIEQIGLPRRGGSSGGRLARILSRGLSLSLGLVLGEGRNTICILGGLALLILTLSWLRLALPPGLSPALLLLRRLLLLRFCLT